MTAITNVSADGTLNLVLVIILATLIAIVWAMRYLVVMQKSLTRIERHIEKLVSKSIKEEEEIINEDKELIKDIKTEKAELDEIKSKL